MTDRKQQTSSTQCRVATTVPVAAPRTTNIKPQSDLAIFTCCVKQSQSVRLPADHHCHCIVIKNLKGRVRREGWGGEAQRKVGNRKSRIIRRTKWSQTFFKTKQEVLKTRLYEAGERPTTDALTFCSELFNDAHSLKLILQPSSPLKKWQPDRNFFSFQSVSKNVLWKSNQDKMKGSTSFQPLQWCEDVVFSRWAEGVDTEIIKFGSQGQNSDHISFLFVTLHMSEVGGLQQERTWSIGEAVCYVQQHTDTLTHSSNLSYLQKRLRHPDVCAHFINSWQLDTAPGEVVLPDVSFLPDVSLLKNKNINRCLCREALNDEHVLASYRLNNQSI